jgi:hypothetical protein
MRPRSLILRNSARCGHCGQEIESSHRHDFRMCRCGALGVDGGNDYIRRIGQGWIDTSLVARLEEDDPAAQAVTRAFQERLHTGWRPSLGDYADAPRLEGWRAHDLHLSAGPASVLIGTVTGHPGFRDGPLIATGQVLAGDERHG